MQKMSLESLEEWLNAPPKQLSKAEEKSLFKPKYLDSLIQFVGQNNGKKSKQIESILESMMQWCFLNKRQEYLQNIYDFLSVNKASLKTAWLIMWSINFNYLFQVYSKDTILTAAACEKIAKDLVVGQHSERSFKKLARLEDGTFAYLATEPELKLYFYIQPLTGKWKFSKQVPLLSFS